MKRLLSLVVATITTGCTTSSEYVADAPEVWLRSVGAESPDCRGYSGIFEFQAKQLDAATSSQSIRSVFNFADLFRSEIDVIDPSDAIVKFDVPIDLSDVAFQVFKGDGFPIPLLGNGSIFASYECRNGALVIQHGRLTMRGPGNYRTYLQKNEIEIRKTADGALIARYELIYRQSTIWGFQMRKVHEVKFYRFEQSRVRR